MSGAPKHVVVVGAGIVGLCVGWHLLKRGLRVTLVERDGPGLGCSSGNSASLSSGSVAPLGMPGNVRNGPKMLLDNTSPLHVAPRYWLQAAPWLLRFIAASRPSSVDRISAALAQLLRPAIDRHREILAEIGGLGLLRIDGQLFVYRNAQQRAKDDAAWALRRRAGYELRELDRAGIVALEPQVGPGYTVGVFAPDQGMVSNPLRHCEMLAQAFAARGGAIVRDRVLEIERRDGRAVAARGEAGRHAADAVVLCAGAWSTELLRPMGYRIPLESQRGYHITLPESDIRIGRPVIPADRKVFITPQETGLRVGGTVEFAGLEAPPNAHRTELLLGDLRAVFPQAKFGAARSDWMGHRPCLPDSMPVIGPSARAPGLWFAFGHGHLGLTGAAVTGDAVARAICGEPAAVDLQPFSAARFGAG